MIILFDIFCFVFSFFCYFVESRIFDTFYYLLCYTIVISSIFSLNHFTYPEIPQLLNITLKTTIPELHPLQFFELFFFTTLLFLGFSQRFFVFVRIIVTITTIQFQIVVIHSRTIPITRCHGFKKQLHFEIVAEMFTF